jgi:hypothetical protein
MLLAGNRTHAMKTAHWSSQDYRLDPVRRRRSLAVPGDRTDLKASDEIRFTKVANLI